MTEIIDIAATLRRAGFWSAYYGGRVADTDRESGDAFLTRVLGTDPGFDYDWLYGPDPYGVITDDMDDDEQDEAMEEARSAGAVLGVELPSGYTWSIRFSSSPGIYHRLTTPDGGRSIDLGYDDPHFHLPILRWREAWRIADRYARDGVAGATTGVPPAFVLPLLAPVTWATSSAEAELARQRLAAAWAATGMVDEAHADALADRLVLVVPDLVWEPHPVHGWVNNGPHSHRNPAGGYWSPSAFALLREFLDAVAAPSTRTAASDTTTGANGPTPLWRFDADGPIEPGVSIAGDQVYCFTARDAKLRALDAVTGQQRWQTGVMSRGFGHNTVHVADGVVYYAGGERSLDLVGFPEHASGEADVTWVCSADPEGMRYQPNGAYSGWADTTPVLADGWLFLGEEELSRWRVTGSVPQRAWAVPLSGLHTPRTRPVVAGERVYIAVADDYRDASAVRAFDVATGESARKPVDVAGTVRDLILHDGDLLVAAEALTALDPATGDVRWSVATERTWCGAIAATASRVVGTTCRGRARGEDHADVNGGRGDEPDWRYTMVGIDRHRHEVAWTFTVPGRLASSGVTIDDDTAYSVGYDDHDATLYAVDATTGSLRWRYPLGRSTCLPVARHGVVFVSTVDGALLALR